MILPRRFDFVSSLLLFFQTTTTLLVVNASPAPPQTPDSKPALLPNPILSIAQPDFLDEIVKA
ncbi:MAG: hypothetical protein Q9216_007104, partial [Gyalolechia sp. 2 TL-2023]